MSLLVVGLSHHSAPVEVLERVVLGPVEAAEFARAARTANVSEAVVVSTCNRVEVYLEAEVVERGVWQAIEQLADGAGLDPETLRKQAYVHLDQAAVAHLFRVAGGLDSMAVGESQILGQIRESLQRAQADSTVGTNLNALFQQALRVGKRPHAETGIDRSAPSVVSAAFDAAGEVIAKESKFLVAGAGSMSVLAVQTLIDRGIEPSQIHVANRSFDRGVVLVTSFGVSAVRWEDLDEELATADVLITCTSAADLVFDTERIAAAVTGGRAMTVIDLALPRDVAHDVRELATVKVIDLEVLSQSPGTAPATEDLKQVRRIIEEEVQAFILGSAQAQVAPTVIALRALANSIVAAETQRLESLLGEVSEAQRSEIQTALQRVAEKLIHPPTVRIKEAAASTAGLGYAEALVHLFRLDSAHVSAVADLPPVQGGEC